MIRMLRSSVPAGALRLLACETLLLAGCLLAATHFFALPGLEMFLSEENGAVRIGVVTAMVIGALFWRGVYIPQLRRQPYLVVLQELCFAFGVAFVAQGVFTYLRSGLRMPLRVLVPGSVMGVAALMLWHSLYGTVIWKSARRRVLFAGEGILLREAAAYVQAHPALGLDLIGVVTDSPAEDTQAAGKRLADLTALNDVVAATRPDLLVIGGTSHAGPLSLQQLLEIRAAGIHLEDDFTFIEQVGRYFPVAGLRPSRLLFAGELGPGEDRLTETAEVMLAAIAVLLLLPVLLAAALAVRLSSPGPVLERRPRVGKDGRIFELYRFRCASGKGQALTAAGRLLRATTVEEWPQLLNVLRGEMSLVGPRPERPEFSEILGRRIPFYRQRQAVKPGLTGWAQIQYEARPEDAFVRLQYDFYYIKYRSRILNNYIVLRFVHDLLRAR